MNYLAHVYLSGDNKDILIGNFIADAVKGKAMDDYSDEIRRGIVLHRAIDEYTDNHSLHRKSRTRLHHRYSHYSGVLVDIFYDHFLAKNWLDYSDQALLPYTEGVYRLLKEREDILPKRINHMLKYMIPHNWLYNYAHLEGIEKVLKGMANRTKFDSKMEYGVEDLQLNYNKFEAEFRGFFPQLHEFVNEKLEVI